MHQGQAREENENLSCEIATVEHTFRVVKKRSRPVPDISNFRLILFLLAADRKRTWCNDVVLLPFFDTIVRL